MHEALAPGWIVKLHCARSTTTWCATVSVLKHPFWGFCVGSWSHSGLVTLLATVCMAVAATVAPATAANQNGLVNINLEDNIVQVPVAIAANVCKVDVAVLVGLLADTGSAVCNAEAFSGATVTGRQGGGGNTRQNGLINVNLENNTIQVPIAAAANICDVTVAILVGAILKDDATQCTAKAGATGITK